MSSVKVWATPLTMGAFFLSAVTGVLLFFHWQSGLNKLAHEWLGWLLIIGGVAHAFANGSGFRAHLKKPVGRAIIGIFVLMLAGSFWSLPGKQKSPQAEAVTALSKAPLSVVAQVAGRKPDDMLIRIKAAGFRVRHLGETIHAIAGNDRQQEKRLFGVIFAPSPQ